MQILSIFVLDKQGKECLSSSHPNWLSHFSFNQLVKDATLRPKHCVVKDTHCYIKKSSEKILLFFCNENMKTQGQINLFFTKINQVKNLYELEHLRKTLFFNNTKQQLTFFKEKMTLSHQKLPPKNREMDLRIK